VDERGGHPTHWGLSGPFLIRAAPQRPRRQPHERGAGYDFGLLLRWLESAAKVRRSSYPDADEDWVVDCVIAGMRFVRQSQSCTAGSRLFLHADIFDSFLDKLRDKTPAQLSHGISRDILERLVRVAGPFPRHLQHPFADDVPLDLIGAAGDRGRGHRYQDLRQ